VEIYGFSATGQGLVAVALLVGTILGEPMAGPFSDWIVRYQAKRHGGIRHPEQRLQAIWLGAVLIPVGPPFIAAIVNFLTQLSRLD
jgi:hypothetical protein